MIINKKFIFGVIVMFSSVCVAAESHGRLQTHPMLQIWRATLPYPNNGPEDYMEIIAPMGVDQPEVYMHPSPPLRLSRTVEFNTGKRRRGDTKYLYSRP